jgi:two-component system, OmpR family, sensor kinase
MKIKANQESLRFKLTVFYTGVVCLLLIVYAFISYRFVISNFEKEINNDLYSRATRAQLFFANNGFTKEDLEIFASSYGSSGNIPPSPDDPMANRAYEAGGDLASALTYIQLVDNQGRVLQRTPDLKIMAKPETQQVLANLISNRVQGFSDVRVASGERSRVYTIRLDRVENRGYIQVVRSMAELDSITTGIVVPLIVVTGISMGIITIFGYWLTRRIFRPLERMTETAYRIGVNNDLSSRIETDLNQNDEVTRLGRSLNAMLDRVEKTFQMQKQFIADSSHELRTPLTVIRGNVDLLKRNPDPKNQVESLGAIEREGARMQRLVQDLLLLAQADARQTVELTPTPLHDMVLEIFQETRVLAHQKKQSLKLGKFDPVMIEADPDRLKRAILNLVDNAIKYTQEEGEITISLIRGKQWARVEVTDNGPGISTKDQALVFDRFYRVDRARSRHSGGSGLGLAIVKHIVEAHGGRINLRSDVGEGSTFTIWLKPAPDSDDFADDDDAFDAPQAQEKSAPKTEPAELTP